MSNANSSEQCTPLDVRPSHEVRFAVVMYGGVSLAIYINGVSQEMLRLVRATAPRRECDGTPVGLLYADSDLSPVERVYREVSKRVGSDSPLRSELRKDEPVQTRFVVDVLAGTSAGGINGIFLAKALARNQSLDELKKLWIDEGEISKLLYDSRSLDGLNGRVRGERKPPSILNSQRMYVTLLDALAGLNGRGDDGSERQPLVDELDLFITTTDLAGVTVPLRLSDRTIAESNYRHVFHLVAATKYGSGDERNDFVSANDPFLAFMARCTSSFPVAFEPMRLADIERVKSGLGGQLTLSSAMTQWGHLFKDYLRTADGGAIDPATSGFEKRAFGDGGYLDNKPFGYAIDALSWRRPALRSERKLLYIEPSPEHAEMVPRDIDRPDAIGNLMLAATVLPRQEAIRGDLQRVLDRNRVIERIRRVTRDLECDLQKAYRNGHRPIVPRGEWPNKWLSEMIEFFGPQYGGYSRLRVAELTSDLAEMVARVAGFREDSDDLLAIRYLVSAWRQHHFCPERDDGGNRAPESTMLMKYDLSYRLRRLQFMQHQLDLIYKLDASAEEAFKAAGAKWDQPSGSDAADLRSAILDMKSCFAEAHVVLRREGRLLRSRSKKNPIAELVGNIKIGRAELSRIISRATPSARVKEARAVLGIEELIGNMPTGPLSDPRGRERRGEPEPESAPPEKLCAMNCAAELLGERLKCAFDSAWGICERALGPLQTAESPPGSTGGDRVGALRRVLNYYYDRYDNYDIVLFPILYGVIEGELDEVDVMRVSPEDATSLVSERNAMGTLLAKKLAGTRFGNFGAFLDRRWRCSDMMWGRLDGAERLIRGLLPSSEGSCDRAIVEQLVGRAQAAIVHEELLELGNVEGRRILVEALLHTTTGSGDEQALAHMIERLRVHTTNVRMLELLSPAGVQEAYRQAMREGGRTSPEHMIRLAARATIVVGRMLEGLADRHAIVRRQFSAAIIMAGRVLWGLVEVAVPRSVGEIIFVYWLQLLYLVEAILLCGALVLQKRPIAELAWRMLGLTVLANALQFTMRRYLLTRSWRKAVPGFLVPLLSGALVLVIAVGLRDVVGLARNEVWTWLRRALVVVGLMKG